MSESPTEKRLVVLTKESAFYIPEEENDSIATGTSFSPSSSLSSSCRIVNRGLRRSPLQERVRSSLRKMDCEVEREMESKVESYHSNSLLAPLLFVMCMVMLLLIGLLVIYEKPLPHSSIIIATLGVMMGYTIAFIQNILD